MAKVKFNITKTIDDLTKMIRTPNYDKETILRLCKKLKQMSPIGFKLLLKQLQTDEDNSKYILEEALSKASSHSDNENFKSPNCYMTTDHRSHSKSMSRNFKQSTRFRDPRQQQRYSKTAEILQDSGLLEVAIKTANLAKESRQIEKELRKLRSESEAFYAAVTKGNQHQMVPTVEPTASLSYQFKPVTLLTSMPSFQVDFDDMEPDDSLNMDQYLK